MESLSFRKDYIEVDGTKYYHYSFGGKWSATHWIVADGVTWYNTNKPLIDERV
jgi:hypothetical protein